MTNTDRLHEENRGQSWIDRFGATWRYDHAHNAWKRSPKNRGLSTIGYEPNQLFGPYKIADAIPATTERRRSMITPEEDDRYGFRWGPLKVTRVSECLGRYKIVITTSAGKRITVYASKTGRSLRVFDGKGNEYRLSEGDTNA